MIYYGGNEPVNTDAPSYGYQPSIMKVLEKADSRRSGARRPSRRRELARRRNTSRPFGSGSGGRPTSRELRAASSRRRRRGQEEGKVEGSIRLLDQPSSCQQSIARLSPYLIATASAEQEALPVSATAEACSLRSTGRTDGRVTLLPPSITRLSLTDCMMVFVDC